MLKCGRGHAWKLTWNGRLEVVSLAVRPSPSDSGADEPEMGAGHCGFSAQH